MKGLKHLLKRLAVAFLVIVAIIVVLGFGVRSYMDRVGTRELATIRNQLDRDEPGWRLEAIQAARNATELPEELNSAPRILDVAEQISTERNKEWNEWLRTEAWTTRVYSPFLPRKSLLEGMESQRASTASARTLSRELIRFERGYYPLVFSENPIMTLLPHVQKSREVVALLEYDGLLAALDRDANGGIAAAHAALNVSRAIGDEPTLISQLVRIGCCRVSTQTALQVLAWGEPTKGLAELQAAYRAEADVPFLLNGLRGERGMIDRLFEGLESGKLGVEDIEIYGVQRSNPVQQAAFYLYKGCLPGDHAKGLEVLTAYIAAAKLPPHEQVAALAAIPIPPGPPDDFRYLITRLMIPACGKVALASLRARAELLAASTAIACERFRQAKGRWPERLEEIPRDILPQVPLDPCTGESLRYQRFADGIAVYSEPKHERDERRRQLERNDPIAQLGYGWRLWSPKSRRQLPPPEPPQEEPVPPPPDEIP